MGEERDDLIAERARRAAAWSKLGEMSPPYVGTPAQIGEIGIRPAGTGQGVYRDLEGLRHLAPPDGIAVSVVDTGTVYTDAFDEKGGEYHFPTTRRGRRDDGEITSIKNARAAHLPLFVVMSGPTSGTRTVKRGWVTDWDDARRVFYIAFDEPKAEQPPSLEEPFRLKGSATKARDATVQMRPGQSRFRFDVFRRYGAKCAACDLAVEALLEAAHILGVSDGGSDDPRNGLALCRNHHRAFDALLLAVDPATLAFCTRADGPSLSALGVLNERIACNAPPHVDALSEHWTRFQADMKARPE